MHVYIRKATHTSMRSMRGGSAKKLTVVTDSGPHAALVDCHIRCVVQVTAVLQMRILEVHSGGNDPGLDNLVINVYMYVCVCV
jgi:hypothetical protein